MIHFFATKFCIYFSGNPPNVTGDSIFPTQKTLQKVMKITRFDAILQVGRRRAFLSIAQSEFMFFHAHFAVICHAFWHHLA